MRAPFRSGLRQQILTCLLALGGTATYADILVKAVKFGYCALNNKQSIASFRTAVFERDARGLWTIQKKYDDAGRVCSNASVIIFDKNHIANNLLNPKCFRKSLLYQ